MLLTFPAERNAVMLSKRFELIAGMRAPTGLGGVGATAGFPEMRERTPAGVIGPSPGPHRGNARSDHKLRAASRLLTHQVTATEAAETRTRRPFCWPPRDQEKRQWTRYTTEADVSTREEPSLLLGAT